MKLRVELLILVSEDSLSFCVGSKLIDVKQKTDLDFTVQQLSIPTATGVVMMREKILGRVKSFEAVYLQFLQTAAWQSLPIELLDVWTEAFYGLKLRPPLHWPADSRLAWSEVSTEPRLEIEIVKGPKEAAQAPWRIEVCFYYGAIKVLYGDPRTQVVNAEQRLIYLRQTKFETSQFKNLFRQSEISEGNDGKLQPGDPSSLASGLSITKINRTTQKIELTAKGFSPLVTNWLAQGFNVRFNSRRLRKLLRTHFQISSHETSYDLRGSLIFGDGVADVPLQFAHEKIDFQMGCVDCDETSVGFIPMEQRAKLNAVSKLGRQSKVAIHFQKAQGPILAALFADFPVAPADVPAVRPADVPYAPTDAPAEAQFDAPFAALVMRFNDHRNLQPRQPSASFRGLLRHYQQEGLGWLSFLSETGFGGILADDMGLGKTVQVIAHIAAQYEKTPGLPLTLVILPKSLLFNWDDEIRKFAPRVRAAIYEPSQKRPLFSQIKDLQVLLITYNTLRQDIESLKELNFHYVIADEAQAIKNPASMVHRACLEIKATHRLAMSGTPVENSVQDLFSIFDFVSPGLIGSQMKQRALKNEDLSSVAQALKPFILRRTKEQVLKDLPAKTEKILYCKLSGAELKRYQQIRDHYKLKVKTTVADKGLSHSGFAVLEGLLRLRQAASHPGLVDAKWANESSAKLDSFMEQLETVMAMGHKALVFSQFTGLLDIVERHLKKSLNGPIRFVRIDGSLSSLKRQASVRSFQSDPTLQVFLISLKAGGTGLNLTAADYVFILDPWWNPASEAQAVDRAHRMGQKNKVMAYRMITKGTVEEKIVALQETKRDLASALVSQDGSMLKSLTNADIELLFS